MVSLEKADWNSDCDGFTRGIAKSFIRSAWIDFKVDQGFSDIEGAITVKPESLQGQVLLNRSPLLICNIPWVWNLEYASESVKIKPV